MVDLHGRCVGQSLKGFQAFCVALLLRVIPTIIAICERGFSKQNIVKSAFTITSACEHIGCIDVCVPM